MGEMIHKPDANPVIFAAANWIGLGGLGYLLMGQTSKAITSVIITVGGSCFFGLGSLFLFVTAYDAYLLGQKLQNGESIGEKENALDFLNMLPGFK